MPPSLSSIAALLLLLLAFFRYIVQPALLSPLSKLPRAHWSSPFTTLFVDKRYKNTGNDRLFHRVQRAHQRHGDIVRIGPNEISVNSAEAVQQIYTSDFFEKSPWYEVEFAKQWGKPPLVATVKREPHTARKKLLAGAYAKSFLLTSPDLSLVTDKFLRGALLPLLQDASERETPVNVLPIFQYASADLLSGYQLGSAHGSRFLTNHDPREKYFGPEITGTWFDCREYGGQLFLRKTTAAIASLGDETPGETKAVVLPKLYHGLRDSKQFSEAELAEACTSELLDNLAASHEGIGTTMCYALWELSKRPSLQQELRAELQTLSLPSLAPYGGNPSQSPTPFFKALDDLPLLHRLLWETLRLHTAAPGMQPRVVKTDGIRLCDFYVPPGTTVSANAYALHRNPAAYPDPLVWDPDRWLPDHQPDKRWFWPFSSGSRVCIGNHFAVAMLKLLLAAVYANYSTSIDDDEGIEQREDFVSPPIGGKLFLRFHSF